MNVPPNPTKNIDKMNIMHNLQFLSNLTQAIELQNRYTGYFQSCHYQGKHTNFFRMAPIYEQTLAYASGG